MMRCASSRTRFVIGRLSALFAVLLLMASVVVLPSSAQVLTGTLTGTVTDSTDSVVPNAAVNATKGGTGATIKEKTDASGVFTVSKFPNRTHNLAVGVSVVLKTAVHNV